MRVVVISMHLRLAVMSGVGSRSSELTRGPVRASLVASDASIEAALKAVKLFEGIGKEAATPAVDLLSNPSA